MSRPLFLDNPRRRWTETARQAQTPAEYASSVHRVEETGYSWVWWAVVLGCFVAGLFLM